MAGTASPASFGTPLALCVQRRNPVRVPRRDILVVASDTPFLELTIYQQDTDTAPLDVSAATFQMSLYREYDQRGRWGACWDYGWGPYEQFPYIVATFPGVPVDAPNGRVDIALAANPAQYVIGRFRYELTMSYGQPANAGIGVMTSGPNSSPNYAAGNYTILSGIINLPPGATVALTTLLDLLNGIGVQTSGLLSPIDGAPMLGTDGAPLTG